MTNKPIQPEDSDGESSDLLGSTGIRNIFPKRLRDARIEAGKLLKQIAGDVGVSIAYLSELENGRKEHPSGDVLKRLSTLLHVPIAYLRGDDLSSADAYAQSRLHEEAALLEALNFPPALLASVVGLDIDRLKVAVRSVGALRERFGLTNEDIAQEINRSMRSIEPDHFERFERDADELRRDHGLIGISAKDMEAGLTEALKARLVTVDHEKLSPTLLKSKSLHLYSLTKQLSAAPPRDNSPGSHKASLLTRLKIREGLPDSYVHFLLATELAYRYLLVTTPERGQTFARSYEIPPQPGRNRRELRGDYEAQQIALRLIMPRETYREHLTKLLDVKSEKELFDLLHQKLLDSDIPAPDLYIARLAQLVCTERPELVDVAPYLIAFQRHERANGSHAYFMHTHMIPRVSAFHLTALHAHHCRRWLSIRLLQRLDNVEPIASSVSASNKRAAPPIPHALEFEHEVLSKYWLGVQRESFSPDPAAAGPKQPTQDLIAMSIAYREAGQTQSIGLTLPIEAFPNLKPEAPAVEAGDSCERCHLFQNCAEADGHAIRKDRSPSAAGKELEKLRILLFS